jgi:uncharacterized membrane protein YkvA (DUF1232 family)
MFVHGVMLAALGYPRLMTPRRRVLAAVLVGLGALAYGISPIDIIPELLTGPIGLIDDAAVWGAAAIGIVKLLQGRRGGSTPPAAS